jgi:hypothetical protein
MNDQFDIARFFSLVRLNVIQERRLYAVSVIGFGGGLFIVFFLAHLFFGTIQWSPQKMAWAYLVTCMVAGILYAGASFPGFRSKDRTICYLLNPASRLEKFLWEGFSRVAFLFVALPVLFWAVYNVESAIVSALDSRFTYAYHPFFFLPTLDFLPPSLRNAAMLVSLVLMVFLVPFAGSAIFSRQPLIKTLFGVSLIFFFNLLLAYVVLEVFHLNRYNISPRDTHIYLFPNSADRAARFFLFASLLTNVWVIAIAWYKLKEKEV